MTLADIYSELSSSSALATLIFFRIGAAMSVMPGIGTQSVPTRIKLSLSLVVSLFISSLFFDSAHLVPPLTVVILVSESVIGLAVGLAFRFMVFALQIAGTIAAQSTSLSQILGNSGVEPMPAMGHILVVGGLALLFMSGFHLDFLSTIVRLYEIWPIGAKPEPGEFAMWMTQQASDIFVLSFRMAVPFVILSMLYNVTLGVINKAMPQLMVSFVGAPIITLGGMIFLALSAPYMLSLWRTAVESFVANPIGGV